MPSPSVIGRFAPSPTGDLHFGSLLAAVGSALQARSQGGRWLVRIEDLDPPREVKGSAERLLDDLRRFGLVSDGPVLRQSDRHDAYAAALARLETAGRLYPCACTRRQLPDGPYPGTCRKGLPKGELGRSLRFRVPETPITFEDEIQGTVCEFLPDTCGDFVVRRADGLFAYQLAVVVDDDWQGVTEVVRGADLLDSTPRQVALQQALGLTTPRYLHLPLVHGLDGKKLSKRDGADPVAHLPVLEALGRALATLGHAPPPHQDLEQRWAWALDRWDARRIPLTAPDVGELGQALYSPAATSDP